MRKFITELDSSRKLFIADYDSYSIEKYKPSPESLLYITKVGMLLFDHIMLPAAFFWQSELMTQIMLRLEDAISAGIILPVIRDLGETPSVKDYFDHRVEESQKIQRIPVFLRPELATEIASKENEHAMQQLYKMDTVAHLDNISLRQIYAEKWERDLRYSVDINSLKFLLDQCNMPSEQIKNIKSSLIGIAQHPQFSRAYCINHIQQNIPSGRIEKLLEERTSWLYLSSNAAAYQSAFYYSRDPYNRMVFSENLSLLASTLSIFGLTKQIITGLSIQDILTITHSMEYKYFITAYNDMVQSVHAQQEDFVKTIERKVLREIHSEKRRRRLYNCLQTIQSCSGTIFLGLLINYFSGSLPSSRAFAVSASGLTVPSILKFFNIINQSMTHCSFDDFKTYIIGKQYYNKVNKMLEIP